MKKEIPLTITFIAGILLIFSLFIPHRPFGDLQERFNDWYIIVAGFTLILGVDSLLAHHWKKIKKREKEAPFSIVLILSFIITLLWGFISGIKHGDPFHPASTFLRYFYTYIFVPLQATMFSLLAFFIASAAYRAFRTRTFSATLLLISASLVMLGRVPEGSKAIPFFVIITFLFLSFYFFSEGRQVVLPLTKYIYFGLSILFIVIIFPLSYYLFFNLERVADWIMNIPQMAAKRGILIGVWLGAIAMSLRIILGIERTYLR